MSLTYEVDRDGVVTEIHEFESSPGVEAAVAALDVLEQAEDGLLCATESDVHIPPGDLLQSFTLFAVGSAVTFALLAIWKEIAEAQKERHDRV